jgi:DegV family protein with EDD domain
LPLVFPQFFIYCIFVMQIAYIDGTRIKRALIVGSRRLVEQAAQLDAINVFPVPDGDTGTNMAGTVKTMAHALRSHSSSSLGSALRAAADSALMGARGNSGAIIAQYLQGLAEELENEIRVTTRRFAEAAKSAARKTYAALSRPREGTILTLLADWSEAAHRLAARSDDFLVVLRGAFDEAKVSLARTTELLPELKRAGVVDAGAQGFFHILEGIMHFIASGRIRDIRGDDAAEDSDLPESVGGYAAFSIEGESIEESQYRYCTECLIMGHDLDLAVIRSRLETLGDSVVVAGSATRAKLHIHSDRPQAVFRVAEAFGEVESQKVDDMVLQRKLASQGRRSCALLVDSAVDLSDALRLELGVERVPVQLSIEGRNYLDRDCLSAEEFYTMLRHGPKGEASTSQPAHAAFLRKFDTLLSHADEVVYMGISSALSGTFEGGSRAAAARPGRVRAIDTKNISVGAALSAWRAAEAAWAGAGADEVAAVAEAAIAKLCFLVAVPDLEGLIRSGRLSRVKGLAARSFGLRPLLTINAAGEADVASLYMGKKNGVKALLGAMGRKLRPGAAIEAIVGHTDAPEEAARLAAAIGERYELARDIDLTTISPALAKHAGLGAVAVAFIEAKP